MNPQIYELAAEVREILAQNETGELSDTDLEAIDRFAVTLDQKVDTYGSIVRELTLWEAGVQAEIDRLQARKQSFVLAQGRIKGRLQSILQVADMKRHETPLFKVWRQNNPASMPFIGEDPNRLPDDLKRVVTTVSPDCKAAMEEWKRTGKVPEGFEYKQGEHLRIK